MKREYFISALSEDGRECITRWIQAESWERALHQLQMMGNDRWPNEAWRITTISEQIAIAEVPLRLQVLAGEGCLATAGGSRR